MATGLAYWAVAGTMVTLISIPAGMVLSPRTGERLGRRMLHRLFRGFVHYLRWVDLVHADLSALDHLGKRPGGFIVAPNHTSLWDVVFIVARLPNAVCVMKKSILKNVFLGGGARLAGYISNDSITRMIREASSSIAEGGQLLLFPEGTRTRPDARWINPIKGGCAIIAGRSGVPILPVFIRSDTRFLQKGWPLWKRPTFPIHLRIDVGDPLIPGPEDSAQTITCRLQQIHEHELSKPHPLRRQIDSPPDFTSP